MTMNMEKCLSIWPCVQSIGNKQKNCRKTFPKSREQNKRIFFSLPLNKNLEKRSDRHQFMMNIILFSCILCVNTAYFMNMRMSVSFDDNFMLFIRNLNYFNFTWIKFSDGFRVNAIVLSFARNKIYFVRWNCEIRGEKCHFNLHRNTWFEHSQVYNDASSTMRKFCLFCRNLKIEIYFLVKRLLFSRTWIVDCV